MKAEEWDQIKALFDEAIELPAADRDAFLLSRCTDPVVRRQVSLMLLADNDTDAGLADIVRDAADGSFGAALGPGDAVGAWRIVREIGRGGMGAVYLAERADESYSQKVAIKVTNLALAGPQALARFRSERQILAALEHPNIARLLDGGTLASGAPYLVMEYVDGEPLDVYCDRHALNTAKRLDLFKQVCSAIHVAHQNLIVHRDIKPDNILVTAEGVPKLLDFGIAKLLDPGFSGMTHAVTQANMRMFTPKYASPEQVMGRQITTASDIYSLGVLLYELLVGLSPYQGADESQQGLLRAICEREPQKPSTRVATLSTDERAAEVCRQRGTSAQRLRKRLRGDLDNIVLMAMRKEPERRYESARRLAADIDNYLNDRPVSARQDTFAYRLGKYIRRNAAAVAVSVGAVALVATLVAFYTLRLAAERDRAQTAALHATQTAEFLQNLFRITDPEVTRGEDITARELLDQGARQLESTLTDQPGVQAMLRETIGNVYASMGLFDEANDLLERSLAASARLRGQDDPALASTLRSLADVARRQSRYEAAEDMAARALALAQSQPDPPVREVARLRIALGEVYIEQGRFDDALTQFGAARTALEAAQLSTDPLFPQTLRELGTAHEFLGDFETATGLLTVALERQRKIHGDVHHETAETMSTLALLLDRQHRYDESIAHYEEVLAITRKIYGDDHPDVSVALADLGRVHRHRGDTEETMYYLSAALEATKRAFGELHSFTAYDMVAVANFGYKSKGMGFSEPLFRRAIEIYEQTLPQNHPHLAAALVTFGSRLVLEGRAAEAREHALRGKAICAATLPEEHWLTAQMDIVLGMVERRTGNEPGATDLLRGGYERLKAGRGLEHGATQGALRELLANLEAVGDGALHEAYAAQLLDRD